MVFRLQEISIETCDFIKYLSSSRRAYSFKDITTMFAQIQAEWKSALAHNLLIWLGCLLQTLFRKGLSECGKGTCARFPAVIPV